MSWLIHSPEIVHQTKRPEEEKEPRDREHVLQGPEKVMEDLQA